MFFQILSFVVFLNIQSSLVRSECVTITGATGFVAGHIVEQLLKKNYTVHGTVRDLKSPNCEFLKDMNKELPGRLKLFQADMNGRRPFDEAVRGCSGLLHVASIVTSRDLPNDEKVKANVKGTISALEAALRERVSNVVVTSSVATISPTKARTMSGIGPYTTADYNDIATVDYGTYAYSKVQAEIAGKEFMKEHNNPFRLATIHFPMAIGPQQNYRVTSSNSVVKVLMSGEIPYFAIPMQIIDVRDVSRAHIFVLENEKAEGRYIVANEPEISSMSLLEVADVLKERYPNYPVPERELPKILYRLIPMVDGRLDAYDVDRDLRGKRLGYDNSRLTNLGFEYIYPNPNESILDAAQSMIRLEIVDGIAHPLPVIVTGTIILVVLVILFVAWCGGLFSKSVDKSKMD